MVTPTGCEILEVCADPRKGCRMKLTICLMAFSVLIFPTVLAFGAHAEEILYYGVSLPTEKGAFQPAGTNFTCTGFDDNRCWDGKAWHTLYPLGPRRYSRAQGEVGCMVIMKITADCWDGHEWYKLPFGRVQGFVLPSWKGGAFRTTPLPPPS
jgi:hypothetical protein